MSEAKIQRSFLNLGLPAHPAVEDKKIYAEFVRVYNAVQKLAAYVDVVQPKIPVLYAEAIALGALVSVYETDGILYARNAVNTDPLKYAVAYCPDNEVAIGDSGEVIGYGIHPFFSGLIPGIRYFLSPSPGYLTNVQPTTSGQIVQPVGFAISESTLMFNPCLQFVSV